MAEARATRFQFDVIEADTKAEFCQQLEQLTDEQFDPWTVIGFFITSEGRFTALVNRRRPITHTAPVHKTGGV